MGGYKLQLPSRGTMEEAISDMPARIKTYVRTGLTVLSGVPENNLSILFDLVLETIQSGKVMTDFEVLTRLGISQADAPVLFGALSLLASVASTREESADQCVKITVDTKLVDASQASLALKFFSAVMQKRQLIRRALQVSSLSGAVLPSLVDFDIVVDVRFGFEKGRMTETAAVILMHINTDARGQEVWLQVTKVQLEGMIKELEETLRNVEQAEKSIVQKSANRE